jgi:hypothetical protein
MFDKKRVIITFMSNNLSNFVFEKLLKNIKMRKKYLFAILIVTYTMILAVSGQETDKDIEKKRATEKEARMGITKLMNPDSIMKSKIKEYATVILTTDPTKLTANEKKVIERLIEAAKIMDDLYWLQTWGDPKTLLGKINNEDEKKFVMINYGPWDRLDNNKAFLGSFDSKSDKKTADKPPIYVPVQAEMGENTQTEKIENNVADEMVVNNGKMVSLFSGKPLGANFYPKDMTKEEFQTFENNDKTSLYTLIRRNSDGSLRAIWYHDAYKVQLSKAAEILRDAAEISDDKEFGKYLSLRADALLTDNYQPSDMEWMDVKNNHIDFVIGPIENYEDALFEYKAAYESFVLVKDMEWSKKLDKYIAQLPNLQKQLPVKESYKKEVPGTSSDLGVYDAIYYAGDCNAGAKTIAINLPNDESVQMKKGSRRLQLKNTMQAKFDNIMLPISRKLIDPSQIKNVKFDAFFNNVMFHEVAHGLGIKNTITDKGTVRESMKEVYSSFEEAKADILGLFMVTNLIDKGEVTDLKTEDCYVTFLAGIFRSVRFGAADAHGKANMMCFNYFEKAQAFKRTEKGTFMVDFENMKKAVNGWAEAILVFQGNGDYEVAAKYLKENATITPMLQKELDRLKSANIPKDIIFKQGHEALGF